MRLTALLAVVVAAAGPLALPSSAAACPGVTSSGRWSSIDLPPPQGVGTQAIESYAVAASRPKLLYAAGGRQVFRSRDGGCSWQMAVSLDTAGSATALSRLEPSYVFVNVIVPNTLPGVTSSTVYALAVDTTVLALAASPPVMLAVSRDDGATWRLSEPAPADLAGDFPRCSRGWLVAGADPQAVYLSCAGIGFVESFAWGRCRTSFYVSRNDGATWSPIEPGVVGCTAPRWSNIAFEPATVADPRSPGWLWGLRTEDTGGSLAQRLVLSTDDGRSVKDLYGKAIGDWGRVVLSTEPEAGPRRIGLYLKAAVYLSTDGGVTATKLPPVPEPSESRGEYVAAFFDRTGSALYALAAASSRAPSDLAPYRYDLRSGSWTVLPPWPAPKEYPPWLSQFRTDSASPLGLYALAAATKTTPARVLVFR